MADRTGNRVDRTCFNTMAEAGLPYELRLMDFELAMQDLYDFFRKGGAVDTHGARDQWMCVFVYEVDTESEPARDRRPDRDAAQGGGQEASRALGLQEAVSASR